MIQDLQFAGNRPPSISKGVPGHITKVSPVLRRPGDVLDLKAHKKALPRSVGVVGGFLKQHDQHLLKYDEIPPKTRMAVEKLHE